MAKTQNHTSDNRFARHQGSRIYNTYRPFSSGYCLKNPKNPVRQGSEFRIAHYRVAARIPSAVFGPSYFRPLMKNVGVLFTPLRTPPA